MKNENYVGEVTLLPTGDPLVFFCPETKKMYVSIIKNNILIKYIPLERFLGNHGIN
jgi:hypothetical protein